MKNNEKFVLPLKITASVFVGFLWLWVIIPFIFLKNFSIGTVFVSVFCVFVLFLLWGKKVIIKAKQKKTLKIFYYSFVSLFFAGCFFALSITGMMIYAANRENYPGGEVTYIVLGSKVDGDRPGTVLKKRLDAYLENADILTSVCVTSGGKTKEDAYSEGDIMRAYLIENGADPQLVISEPNSLNTRQNIKYCAEIIEERGLSKNVVIVTDGFHQFRSQQNAVKFGLNPYAMSSATPFWYIASSSAREVIANVRLLVLGY